MDLIGFEKTKSKLKDLYNQNKLPHAILLCGKQGIGKKTFALEFCLEILESDNKNHPDLLIIEKDPEKRDLSIDKIRNISSFLSKTSSISKDRFIIIDSGDDLNLSSSNALLKTLEEPSDNCFIILICHLISKLLPTIKSRCQIVKIPDFGYEEFKNILEKIRPSALPKLSKEEIMLLSKICDFSPVNANKYGDDMIFIYEEFLNSIQENNLNSDLIKKISDKNFDFEILRKVFDFFFLRFSKFLSGVSEEFLLNEKDVFVKLSQNIKAEEIFLISEKASDLLRKTKSLNLDKKLTLVNIFNFFR